MITDNLYLNESFNVFANNLRKDAQSSNCEKSYPSSFLHDSVICRNTANLSKNLNINTTNKDNEKVTVQSIKHGSELFLYLNACPRQSVLDYWSNFYDHLFIDTVSSQQKVLTLFKIIKDRKSKDGQEIANKIMVRLSSELGFRYNLPEVSKKRIIREEINWKNSIRNITGKHLNFY